MKPRNAWLAIVFAVGCSGVELPTTPGGGTQPTPVTSSGAVAGFVLDASQQCIPGARVELVGASGAGTSVVQKTCGFWDYDDGNGNGYVFHNLPFNTPITLRATAPGYKPGELRVSASSTYSYVNNFLLIKE